MKQAFQIKVKDFVERTGMTISAICKEVGYSQNSKFRKYVYQDNFEKDLELKTIERISNFIDNYGK
jgi:hypothetical protein